jgi:hypothetical protein
MSVANPASTDAADVRSVPVARRFRGLYGDRDRRRGLRVDAPLDAVSDGLRSLGVPVTYEPIENGIPTADALGAFRTWGSPWTDLLEQPRGALLTAELARALSAIVRRRALVYDYAFGARVCRHQLFDRGECVETWEAQDAAAGGVEQHLNDRYRALGMRDWGIDIHDLEAVRLPFSLVVVVEAYFLRLSESPLQLWKR